MISPQSQSISLLSHCHTPSPLAFKTFSQVKFLCLVWCYFGDISKSRLHLTVMKRDVVVRFKCIWRAKSCVSVQNDMTFFPFLLSL